MKLKLALINNSIKNGYLILSKNERLRLMWIVFLSILTSAIEVIGVTAIMPFISIASNPSLIHTNKYINALYTYLGFQHNRTFAIVFGFSLVGFYFIRGGYNLFFQSISNKFIAYSEDAIRLKIFKKYIYLPYSNYVNKNSSILQTNVGELSNRFAIWISALLQLLTEITISITLYVILLFVNFKMTVVLTVILGVKVILLSKFTVNKLKNNGHKFIRLMKILAEIKGATFGNFKIIKLRSNQENITQKFAATSKEMAYISARSQSLQQMPRVTLETVGFSMLIGVVLYILFRSKDLSVLIPIISMYAIALYRMLPSLNRILSNYSQIVYNTAVVDSIKEELQLPEEHLGNTEVIFSKEIYAKNIEFKYSNAKTVLNDISLTIKKGEKIAFTGESGSGKSTLISILTGVYPPSIGNIYIDGTKLDTTNIKSWRQKIGYIPQHIYLFDGSVRDNITFGSDYSEERVIDSLKKANIYEFLLTKDGVETRVGEGGIQLSGGQKQRIGIARALYLDPEILVLDEATSALDTETEEEVMHEIYKVSLNKTLIVIAHRMSTIAKCDRVVLLENGRIKN